jgi:probable rRNA maturation factor
MLPIKSSNIFVKSKLNVQIGLGVQDRTCLPSHYQLKKWIKLIFATPEINQVIWSILIKANLQMLANLEMTVKIVDHDESAALNYRYRHKHGSTNVLSFTAECPASIMEKLNCYLLGDLVICAPLVQQEAMQQQKTLMFHWAHMIVHGVLHLLGYDHEDSQEALVMEKLEVKLMQQLGFAGS